LLIADVDASLAQWAGNEGKIFAEELVSGGIGRARDEIAERSETLPANFSMRIETGAGQAVFEAGGTGLPAIPARLRSSREMYWTAGAGEHEMRLLTRPVGGDESECRLLMAASLARVNLLLRRFHWILLVTLPLTLAIASLGGYWISARALAPVDALTSAARAIGIGNLSQRLQVPRASDELQRLSKTWNEMLERLEAAVTRLSRFTADASHELRSPIALIRATAEIALSDVRSPERYRSALEQILAASIRVTNLVEELLEAARAEALHQPFPLHEIDLRNVVKEARSQMAKMAAAREQTLAIRIGESPAGIIGNETALRRLFSILIENAIKFTPPGGRIELIVENGAPGWAVSVRDNGTGIAAEALPHIFERFFRADPARSLEEGAGLGLSIAEAIAKAHSAEISVKSAPGEGSVFSVQFLAVPSD
jgi:signal transduction histidine kinase